MSKVYKLTVGGKVRKFIYFEELAIVSYVGDYTEEYRRDNEEWNTKHCRNLWDTVKDASGTEFLEISSVGLSRENWENKACRDEYLTEWVYEMDSEIENMII